MTDAADHRPWSPALREAAVSSMSKEWGTAIEQGADLRATFERLAGALRQLAEQGSRQTLVFIDPLVQRWWVAFQESRGDLVPMNPSAEPPHMPHEDQIVREHAG